MVNDIFGSMVFSDAVMKQRLPKETYNALHQTVLDGRRLDIGIALLHLTLGMREIM